MKEFLNKLFRSNTKAPVNKKLASLEEFPSLDVAERVRQVVFCGDSGAEQYYPLLKYVILSDPDKDVKMAALKRIHLFESHTDTVSFIENLGERINTYTVEPYYSMALSRLKLISTEEFQARADKGFKY